jgi:type VI secretion system protein
MGLGIFDALTGQFANGMPVDAISPQRQRIMSLMSHLQYMFNTNQGAIPNSKYGLPHLPETFGTLPNNTIEFSKILETAIREGEPNIKKVSVIGWSLDKKNCFLQCCLSCVLNNGDKIKFRFKMIGCGKYIVEPWTGRLNL